MSSTNHTQHYGLSQWEPKDAFLRTDFNEDHEKIDEALACATPVAGTYVGTASSNAQAEQSIHLGFRPKIVLVLAFGGNYMEHYGVCTHLALDGADSQNLRITDTGFCVKSSCNWAAGNEGYNSNRNPYRYIAWR